ncbi:hypothetical protein [Clostridium sp. DJ247]|nr:hypothetical protein [Clostridium sp. DJ247]MBC2581037.1 hypothetical protein [Clostridium sp. DJ247]
MKDFELLIEQTGHRNLIMLILILVVFLYALMLIFRLTIKDFRKKSKN